MTVAAVEVTRRLGMGKVSQDVGFKLRGVCETRSNTLLVLLGGNAYRTVHPNSVIVFFTLRIPESQNGSYLVRGT